MRGRLHVGGEVVAAFLATVAPASAVTSAHAQQAVQWRVEDGGNGHWYAVIFAEQTVCWNAARDASESIGGHLAVITGVMENAFVRDRVVKLVDPGTGELGPYIGATCEGLAWQDWHWVTGEPFSFSAFGSGEPNSGGSERYLHLWHYPNSLHWNDCVGCSLTRSYVIEWEADCNGDGIIDYGQIRAGQLADANGNGVPDACEAPSCNHADIVDDGQVNGADLGLMLAQWGAASATASGDLNKDGSVNGADLSILLSFWGACPNE